MPSNAFMTTFPGSQTVKTVWNRVYRRLWSGAPTSKSPETDLAWQQRQFKYYATQLPYSSPLSHTKGNLTGETWEMRQAYREWAFKEPAMKAALLTKCLAVAQLTPSVIPANKKNPRDREAARWLDWSINNAEGGYAGLLVEMLLPALIDGFSVTEKVWGHVKEQTQYHGRWTLEQTASIDTQDIRFRLDEYRQVIGVQSVNGATTALQLDPEDFIIFTHLKFFENPFGMSDMRAAVRSCRMIESAIRLRHILLTNYSGPFLKASAGDPATRAALIKVMDDARANGWIVVPTGAELEVVNLATANLDVFRATIEDYRQEIVQAIQGAYLQLMEGSNPNARGDTKVAKSVSELYQWWLATWAAQVVNKQLVQDIVAPAYGYQSGLPRVSFGGVDEAFVMQQLDKFKKGQELGFTLSKEQVADVGGFESPNGKDDMLIPPAAAPSTGTGSSGDAASDWLMGS